MLMPQPVTRIPQAKNRTFLMTVFEKRPEHMQWAFRIVATASMAEQWVGNVLVSLSPHHAIAIANFFNGLEADSRKSTAIDAIALMAMDSKLSELYKIAIKKLRSTLKLRNPFAHSRFGWSDDVDDLLLVVDSRNELLSRAMSISANHTEDWDLNLTSFNTFSDNVMAYRLKELQDIVTALEGCIRDFTDIWIIISRHHDDETIGRVLDELDQRLQSWAKRGSPSH